MAAVLLAATLLASGACMGSESDYHESLASEGENEDANLGASEDEVVDKAFRRFNGFKRMNGLKRFNGVVSVSGFSTAKLEGNTTYSGVARTSIGKDTVRYLVECALPTGDAVFIGPNRFYGSVGLAPEWKLNSCSTTCQEKVTACMLALTNGPGKTVEVELAGSAPLGYGHGFSGQEATFFGNIFAATPRVYFCFGSSLYTTRMCQDYEANAPNSCPYFEARGLFCENYGPNNSKKGACTGWSNGTPTRCTGADGKEYQHPITVYRSGGNRNQYLSAARITGEPVGGGAAGEWWRLGL
jgi:hypothetical protein